jgi:hypothetical protein
MLASVVDFVLIVQCHREFVDGVTADESTCMWKFS